MLIGVDASRALRIRPTGTERYALQIITHLLQLPAAAEHTWRLYGDAAAAFTEERTPGAEAVNVQWRLLPARRLWTHHSLANEVLHHPPDVLFIPAHVIPFVLPPQRLPPAVVTVHDLGYRLFPAAHSHRQRWYLDWSTRWSAKVASRIIAISEATAHDLTRFYGVNQRKIDVIYEATVPPPSQGAAAPAPPPQLERPYALFVGTLQPRKNLVRLAQAYAQLLRTENVGWDLVLAGGEGWLSEEVITPIEALNLPHRIHRLGYVADDCLEVLLRNALFFCYVSLYEGFGLPVLEAQDRGTPVMTANNSSLPEVAGDAALLVDPLDVDAIANAMLRLSSDETLRQQLIAAGHANVARFSWQKAARQTLDVLVAAAQGTR